MSFGLIAVGNPEGHTRTPLLACTRVLVPVCFGTERPLHDAAG